MWDGYYGGWAPYVPVAQKLANAKRDAAKMLKGKTPQPIKIEGRKITTTFWGNAWCENLETYSDFENRIPRGRSYVRNGSVVHLEITDGKVKALVAGSSTYTVEIKINPLGPSAWKAVKKQCAGQIGSAVELLQGKLSKNILSIITAKKGGLFPSPKEISFDCSCPDGAYMCKHVAAVLYGVGARFDNDPKLFFTLRGVDYLDLISTVVTAPKGKKDAATLDESNLSEVFGIELSSELDSKPVAAPRAKRSAKKLPKPKATPKKATPKKSATPKKKAKLKVKATPKKKATPKRTARS